MALLLRTGLVPRWLAVLDPVGYALHLTGSAAEIFGAPISLVLLIPGGIFEVTLAIWLLVKGFAPASYDGPSCPRDRRSAGMTIAERAEAAVVASDSGRRSGYSPDVGWSLVCRTLKRQ